MLLCVVLAHWCVVERRSIVVLWWMLFSFQMDVNKCWKRNKVEVEGRNSNGGSKSLEGVVGVQQFEAWSVLWRWSGEMRL